MLRSFMCTLWFTARWNLTVKIKTHYSEETRLFTSAHADICCRQTGGTTSIIQEPREDLQNDMFYK